MRYAGDFHIHSHYSRATSKQLVPEMLDLWGRLKGLAVIGTGDFTHPGWIEELEEAVAPAEEGLFVLKEGRRLTVEAAGFGELPAVDEAAQRRDGEASASAESGGKAGSARLHGTRFLLTAEISSIYKQDGRVRKVHNVVFAPSFETARRIQKRIEGMGGNIRSDGRPILGIASRDLLELCLEVDPTVFFLPAHIWTPWFSTLGSKSGFNSVAECFRDLSGHIRAVETGLSSDPPMNWMCSFLDGYTLVSNSDAHSLERLAREACLFDGGLSYPDVVAAMSNGAAAGFRGTIEFFPQEGKYHFDGHRKCGMVWDPLETLRNGGICPSCGRPVTVGVLSRVAELADREDLEERPSRDPYHSLIPLAELLSEVHGAGPTSKTVRTRYAQCLRRLGPEIDILMGCDPAKIAAEAGEGIAASVDRMRKRQVRVAAGYDGEYGTIRVWGEGESPVSREAHPSLFLTGGETSPSGGRKSSPDSPRSLPALEFDLRAYQSFRRGRGRETHGQEKGGAGAAAERGDGQEGEASAAHSDGTNPAQEEAAGYAGGHLLIIAGPGSGKTFTIVRRVERLVERGAHPGQIFAVTFANRAARELLDRLRAAGVAATSTMRFGEGGEVRVGTLHSLGLAVLKLHLASLGRDDGFFIVDEQEKDSLLGSADIDRKERSRLSEEVSRIKNGVAAMPADGTPAFGQFRSYQAILKSANCFDFDDLIYLPLRLFERKPEALDRLRNSMEHLIIDEYQDVSPAQFELARALGGAAHLCAVGDPNQAIYGFRGASPRFIERFSEDFPGARVVSLKKSYRCPDPILSAGAQLLGSSSAALLGRREELKISLMSAPSAAFEAEQIARDIEMQSGGVSFFSFDSGVTESGESAATALADIAVLCRTRLQMPSLEKAFHDHRIPYRAIRLETPFAREPYRSFLNLVRLLLPRKAAARRVFLEVKSADPERIAGLALPGSLAEALEAFSAAQRAPLAPALLEQMELDLSRYWSSDDDAAAFVEHARLGSGLDRYDSRMEAVSLMTIHASKGLEFDLVYVPGCEDSIIPCSVGGDDATDEGEERRLLYVAMTRSRRRLVLSSARSRVIFGERREQRESPFLAQIEDELLERRRLEAETPRDPSEGQLSLLD